MRVCIRCKATQLSIKMWSKLGGFINTRSLIVCFLLLTFISRIFEVWFNVWLTCGKLHSVGGSSMWISCIGTNTAEYSVLGWWYIDKYNINMTKISIIKHGEWLYYIKPWLTNVAKHVVLWHLIPFYKKCLFEFQQNWQPS